MLEDNKFASACLRKESLLFFPYKRSKSPVPVRHIPLKAYMREFSSGLRIRFDLYGSDPFIENAGFGSYVLGLNKSIELESPSCLEMMYTNLSLFESQLLISGKYDKYASRLT